MALQIRHQVVSLVIRRAAKGGDVAVFDLLSRHGCGFLRF